MGSILRSREGTWSEEYTINGRADLVKVSFNTSVAPRLLTVTTAESRVLTAEVDAAGRPTTISSPGQDDIDLIYGLGGRDSVIEQGSRGIRFGYDGLGRLTEVRDTLDRMTTFTHDNADRVRTQTLPGGLTITYGYDLNGNLDSLSTPASNVHLFSHTEIDQVKEYTPPDIGLPRHATTYTYNDDHQLTDVLRPDSVEVELDYDAYGRLEFVRMPRGSVQVAYDGSGRLSTISSPDTVTVTYEYDGDLVKSEAWTGAVTETVTVSYDRDFRIEEQTVGSDTVSFSYDQDGLQVRVRDLGFTRDASSGQLLESELDKIKTEHLYSASGELEAFRADSTAGTGGKIFGFAIDRDDVGRITEARDTVGTTARKREFEYDDAGRLYVVLEDADTLAAYWYDLNGNRVLAGVVSGTPSDTSTGTYDAQDRLTRWGADSLVYSGNGELLKWFSGSDSILYDYDELGNLLKVTPTTGDTVTYIVDGLGRRVGRKLNGILRRTWVYSDRLNIVAELDSLGTVVSRFVYGSQGHVPDYMVREGVEYRLVTDHLGSVRAVVRASDGHVQQRLRYGPWGEIEEDTNPGFQPFGYAGGQYDPVTGLVRFGARDYSAKWGRWLSKDKIGFRAGATNVYEYVSSDPINFFDQTGLARVKNNSGVPIVVSGNPGREDGKGRNRYAVVPADGLIYGVDRPLRTFETVEEARAYRDGLSTSQSSGRCPPTSPSGPLLYDVDYYHQDDGSPVKIIGDDKGPTYTLVWHPPLLEIREEKLGTFDYLAALAREMMRRAQFWRR